MEVAPEPDWDSVVAAIKLLYISVCTWVYACACVYERES